MLMKQTLIQLVFFAVALVAASCSKDYLTPEELFKDSSKLAKTVIHTKGNGEKTETTFQNMAVYRKSEMEGKSWFVASSGGRMVYDMFMLSIYFDSIDKMKVGETLKPSRVMFSFTASSDSNATTYSYQGKITLAGKGDDYVIFHFKKVRFSCSLGDYLTDGYLQCPLYDEFIYPDFSVQ